MQKPALKYITPEEYLEREVAAEFRSEYYQGEIFALAGGSLNHNQIIGNVYAPLHHNQKHHKCRVAMSDLRLWVEERGLFTYPDIMIICDKPQLYNDRSDTISNPLIIFEVLSESTKNYDRSEKFEFYRSISTFQEYILIDQYKIHIEQFHIGSEGKWVLTEYNDINDVLKLEKIDFQMPLQDIYSRVDFENG